MDSPRPLDCASFASNVVLFISDIYVAKEVFQLPGHDWSQFETRGHHGFSIRDYLQL